ncbi:cupin domain-containing protein [Frankia sp. Cj3]|uniref:cupin domain-containing protein n=1 Tax=Frankia sp. Cj3 TaxID=2880976 RepID=UPI001EF459D7|nr:cupin domain-containing protein [Frankia sp. Cj3]
MHDHVVRNVFRSGFEMSELTWTSWVEPGRAGVEHHILWAPDDGGEDSAGLLLRFPPGAHGDFHEHLGYELMLVFDGTLDRSDGRSFSAGDLVVEGPGTRHQMSSRLGCTVLAIRSKPAVAREPSAGEIRNTAETATTGTHARPAASTAEESIVR